MSIMVIDGLGQTQYRQVEYTSSQVGAIYTDNLETLKRILDKRPDANPSGIATAADYDSLLAALRSLKNLAKDGITEGVPPVPYYLTAQMAQNLDMVVRSLTAVGISLSTAGLTSDQKIQLLKNWQSLAGFGIEDLMRGALASVASPRSLQSMIELEYVKEGNDLISSQLASLEEALQTTQGIADTLTIVQNISNQVTVTNRGNFAFPPSTNGDLPVGALTLFESYAARFLGAANGPPRPIDLSVLSPWPSAGFIDDYNRMRNAYIVDLNIAKSAAGGVSSGPIFQSAFSSLHSYSDAINSFVGGNLTRFSAFYKIAASTQFSQLFPVATPVNGAATQLLTAKNSLMNQLTELESQSSTNRHTPNSLASFIFAVAKNISTAFASANTSEKQLSALKTWILDNQQYRITSPEANTAGSIQSSITQAIKATESLNDAQKQQVSRYLFIFQEFYKSSSAVLQKVQQIVERMAQAISR